MPFTEGIAKPKAVGQLFGDPEHILRFVHRLDQLMVEKDEVRLAFGIAAGNILGFEVSGVWQQDVGHLGAGGHHHI